MQHISRLRGYHLALLGVFVAVLTLIGISNVGAAADDQARGGRLVTIHDRGGEKVVLTHAQTVHDALSDAHVAVAPEDQVEPTLDDELVATDYTVNIYRARPVIVVDGPVRQKIMTAAQTAEAIMAAAGMQLHDEDKTTMRMSGDVIADGAGVVVTIDRATAFTLNLYGKVTTAYSQEKTVGAMLAKKKIRLGKDDSLSVAESAPITAGMTVAIWRNGVQTATVEEPIAFPVRQIQDADQPAGYSKVQTAGMNGRKNVTYEITMQNGKEVGRKVIQSVTVEEPKEQIEIIGAKTGFSGSFSEALARLRSCEGKYTSNTGNGYYGAYQFDKPTWGGYGGYAVASDAPPAIQDQKAWETYKRRGWQPWPSCSKSMGLQDIYR